MLGSNCNSLFCLRLELRFELVDKILNKSIENEVWLGITASIQFLKHKECNQKTIMTLLFSNIYARLNASH